MEDDKTATLAWEAEGHHIQAELYRVNYEWNSALVNQDWVTASQLENAWHRLDKQLADHTIKRH